MKLLYLAASTIEARSRSLRGGTMRIATGCCDKLDPFDAAVAPVHAAGAQEPRSADGLCKIHPDAHVRPSNGAAGSAWGTPHGADERAMGRLDLRSASNRSVRTRAGGRLRAWRH